MNAYNLSTPGTYINEVNAFPNSVVAVETAVPAFIGYTPQAEYEGQSYLNKAQKITSFAEFLAFYALPNPLPPAEPVQQYSPQYYLVEQKELPTVGEHMIIGSSYYSILPDPNTIYYLYNSVQLFYQNGGGEAYIVSVGPYGVPSGKPMSKPGSQIVNANVSLDDLQSGLALLKNQIEPTMYICPEATLLSLDDNSTLMKSMLLQAQTMQTSVCLFDVIGGRDPDPILYTNDITAFKDGTGTEGLKYGVCYYPWVCTTIMQPQNIDFTNLFGGEVKKLQALLNPPENPNPQAASILSMIEKPPGTPLTNSQYNAALVVASQTYSQIMTEVLSAANILPPSGGMAGVYTTNDINSGVWNAPANVSMVSVFDLPLRLSAAEQGPLNVDAVTGKSINAIRYFNGEGPLVWGARTLDGNSLDWRYVSVRRTVTFLEQSCKLAARAYVFQPNDSNTWSGVKSMISSFLTDIWKEGGLQGSTAAEAFQVSVGLGSTMTAEDILNGYMRVSIKIAVTHPVEYIVLTFEQEMQTAG